MKLACVELEQQITFNSGQCAVWIIESPCLFAEYVQELYVQSTGGEGRFVLSDNDKEISIEKYAEIIVNPFAVNINDRRILGKLYTELHKKAYTENMYMHTQKIISELNQYFAELERQESYFLITDDEIDITAIFKAIGIKVESCADNFMQNINQYIQLMAEILSKKAVIFVNLSSYTESEQMEEIIRTAAYNEIALLFIESSQKDFPQGAVQYIIDNDRCEI